MSASAAPAPRASRSTATSANGLALYFSSVESGPAAVCETPPQVVAMEQHETESAILQLLAQLPDNQQEVVRLKFQENLSYRDIAEVTGLSVSNVGYLLHVALKRLRQQLSSNS